MSNTDKRKRSINLKTCTYARVLGNGDEVIHSYYHDARRGTHQYADDFASSRKTAKKQTNKQQKHNNNNNAWTFNFMEGFEILTECVCW